MHGLCHKIIIIIIIIIIEIIISSCLCVGFTEYKNNTNNNNNKNKNNKQSRVCQIIDVACLFNTRKAENEREMIDHYQDLKVEVQKMWNCKSVSVVPVVIGALGAVTKNLMMWVTKIGTPGILNLLQKACFLGTAKILRRTLDT